MYLAARTDSYLQLPVEGYFPPPEFGQPCKTAYLSQRVQHPMKGKKMRKIINNTDIVDKFG